MIKTRAIIAAVIAITASAWASAQEYPIDKASGLIMAPGWEIVNYQCNACHTTLLIPQNPGDKEVWRATIQWMIDTQGLWDLSDTWEPVLSYLSTYYDEKEIDMSKFRRQPLNSEQQPALPESK